MPSVLEEFLGTLVPLGVLDSLPELVVSSLLLDPEDEVGSSWCSRGISGPLDWESEAWDAEKDPYPEEELWLWGGELPLGAPLDALEEGFLDLELVPCGLGPYSYAFPKLNPPDLHHSLNLVVPYIGASSTSSNIEKSLLSLWIFCWNLLQRVFNSIIITGFPPLSG